MLRHGAWEGVGEVHPFRKASSASQCLRTSCVRMCCLSGPSPSRPPLAAYLFQLKAVTLQHLSLRPPPYVSSSVPACTTPQRTCQPCGRADCTAVQSADPQFSAGCRLFPRAHWPEGSQGSAECACMQLNIRLSMQLPTSNVEGLETVQAHLLFMRPHR